MDYNYIPKYIRQSENKSPKSVVTASRWNELFNLLIQQGDHTAEELGNILNYFSTVLVGVESEIAESAEAIANIRGTFRINVSSSNGVYSADKTFDEIRAAYDAGQQPFVVLTGGTFDLVYTLTNFEAPTDGSEPKFVDFARYLVGDGILETEVLRIYSYTTDSGSNVVKRIDEFKMPTSLKNPNALTFTDGATGSYDGSAPMTVKIPIAPTKTSQLTNDSGFLTSHQDISGKLDKTGGVISGNLGVTGALNIGATVAVSETNVNLLKLAGEYDAPVTIRNVATPDADNDVATKKYVDDHAGGGGESVLYVNITKSGSTITGDKTYAEIIAAATANKCVIAKFADLNFYLDSVANNKITFQRLDIGEDDESRKSINQELIYVYNDGVWTGDAEFVAVDTAMSDTSRMPVQNKVVKAYVDGKQDKSTLEADVAAKGFTKNTGTYSKPSGGIPKADLAAAVQTSLGKADTALQEHQSLAAYRTAAAQDVIDNGKVDKVTGKGLSTNDYTAAAKAKVDAIPANPKYTDTVYDDTALKERVATIEGKESAWDAKLNASELPTAINTALSQAKASGEFDGVDGKSAYQYAVEGGYTGTETEFAEKLASGALTVHVTDNNGTLSADKSFIEIKDAINTGISVFIDYNGMGLPLAAITSDNLYFGITKCSNGDTGAAIGTLMIEITPDGVVNDISTSVETLRNPNAITFTGDVNAIYDGSIPLSVNIPTAPTKTSQLTNDSGYLTLATLPKYGGESE